MEVGDNMNLLKLESKKNLKGSIIWAVVLSGILFLYLAFFPSMKDAGFSELLEGKLDMLPAGFLETFGLTEIPDFSVFMEYYSYVFQFIIIGLSIYGMVLGTKSLSSEEGDKTIEFLYAKPITRTQIVISKMLSSIISILIVLISVILISILSDLLFSDGSNIEMIINLNKIMIIPVLVYWAIGFLISSFLKSDSKSIVISLSIFFGTYLLGIIAGTINDLEFLNYFSPINYNTTSDVFKFLDGRDGVELNIVGLIISAIIYLVSTLVTFFKYNKKDLMA